jgi:hypothetical protein
MGRFPTQAIWPTGPGSRPGQGVGRQRKSKATTGHGNPYLARVLGAWRRGRRADQHLPGRTLSAHRPAPRRQAGHRRGRPFHLDHRLAPAVRPTARFHDLAPASTTPASTLNATSATTSANSRHSVPGSPCNPPPERGTDRRCLDPGSAALRRKGRLVQLTPRRPPPWPAGSHSIRTGNLPGGARSCRRRRRCSSRSDRRNLAGGHSLKSVCLSASRGTPSRPGSGRICAIPLCCVISGRPSRSPAGSRRPSCRLTADGVIAAARRPTSNGPPSGGA